MCNSKRARLGVIPLLVLSLFIVSGVCSAAFSAESSAGEAAARILISEEAKDLEYVPGQIILKLKTSSASQQLLQALIGLESINSVLDEMRLSDENKVQLLDLLPNVSVDAMVEQLSVLPFVEYAEPNHISKSSYTPNDPSFANQWGFNNTGQTIQGVPGTPDADIDAVEAWDIERGQSNPVTVAVIDSGIDLSHPDLKNKLWTNTGEIPGNGIDDDGNGYIDDYNGYNWAGISQYAIDYEWAFGASSGSQYWAQSIKGTGGDLTHIGVALSKVGSPTQPITVSVRSTLSGSYLAQCSVYPGSIPTYPDREFFWCPLSSSVKLNSGSTYYIGLDTAQNSTTNYYALCDADNVYADGQEYLWNGSSWDVYSGYDLSFVTNPNHVPRDDNGHGTHCAGIVGAETNNSTGVSGTSPGAKIMPLKAGDCAGYLQDWSIAQAIMYASDNGADIISMSFGGTGYSSTTANAVDYARAKGVAMFAAAGNDGDTTINYPAGYDYVIGVAATNNQDTYAPFSNYNSTVDISAPGVNVYSTMPTYATSSTIFGYPQNYAYLSGTSMSCPMAAGLGALILSRNPTLSPSQVEQGIINSADDKGLPGWDPHYGYGRINAYQALLNTPPVFKVEASVSGGHGSVSPTSQMINQGGSASISISPNAGYHIGSITDNGNNKPIANPYTIAAINENHYVVVTFATNTYAVNASVSGGHGQVSPAAQAVNYGANVSIDLIPDSGYRVAAITDNGVAKAVANPYVIANVREKHDVVVTFTKYGAASTWYLAEGSTNWGFDCYVSIVNPNDTATNVKLTYMTSAGTATGPTLNMPPKSQATIYPSSTLGASDFSTKVECVEGKPIGVDRTMYWTGPGAACAEAHCATGVTSAATTWYMPEGSSNWGFECYLLIQNPNPAPASCQITWMIQGESAVTFPVTVPASSRSTFNMADFVGSKDASIRVVSDRPVIPERAMYRNNRREGHASTGTTAAAADYYLAEGCTGFGFTTYVLVQNPQNTPTDVIITYQAAGGPVPGPSFQMPANSRHTICVNDSTAIPGPDPSFSTHVHGSQPIIAERAMYWHGGPDAGEACHDSIGLDQPHTTWYLADGQTSEGRETFTLVQNPNDTSVTVKITYMTPSGAGNVAKTETIPANSRRTFNMADHSGIVGRAAIAVTSITPGKKIMVERAMYWNSRGAGTDTIGGHDD